jgi:succinate dehydrogenase / fumarate reductase, cytochrome b subunit
MADASTTTTKPRPKVRPGENMRLPDALQYKLPPAALVSILHRVSGILMFMAMPFVIWLFDQSLTSRGTYDTFLGAFARGVWIFPGWSIKLVCLALIWAYLHHFISGIRHLWMDMTHSVTKAHGRISALVTLGSSVLLTLVLMGKLFGWY